MNYIYSVFKRSNTNSDNNFSSYWLIKYVIVTMLSYVLFVLLSMLVLEKAIFEYGNVVFELLIGLCCAFIVVFPIIYAFIPGYRYLESVQKYSQVKAIKISVIIGLSPVLLMLLILTLTK